MTDYLFYVHDGTLYTKSLASQGGWTHDELRIPVSRHGEDPVTALTYDYGNNCVYWLNQRLNAVQVTPSSHRAREV